MGVYIKGMEMPKGNDELRLIIRSNVKLLSRTKRFMKKQRPSSSRRVGG